MNVYDIQYCRNPSRQGHWNIIKLEIIVVAYMWNDEKKKKHNVLYDYLFIKKKNTK